DPAGDPPPTTPTTTGEEPPRQTDTGQPGPHSPSSRDAAPDPATRRFAEQLEPLEEPEARRLWEEATRITARHNPYPLTIKEGAASLRDRDPQRYWATMQVARALHEFQNAPDRDDSGSKTDPVRGVENAGFQVPDDLREFEVRFGKLEKTVARKLSGEAITIAGKYRPFKLTVQEGAAGMRERDPRTYWAMMRVARTLLDNKGKPDRFQRAEDEAQKVSEEFGGAGRLRAGVGGSPHGDRPSGPGDGPDEQDVVRQDVAVESHPQGYAVSHPGFGDRRLVVGGDGVLRSLEDAGSGSGPGVVFGAGGAAPSGGGVGQESGPVGRVRGAAEALGGEGGPAAKRPRTGAEGDGRDQVDSPAWSFDLSGWDPALLDSPAPGVGGSVGGPGVPVGPAEGSVSGVPVSEHRLDDLTAGFDLSGGDPAGAAGDDLATRLSQAGADPAHRLLDWVHQQDGADLEAWTASLRRLATRHKTYTQLADSLGVSLAWLSPVLNGKEPASKSFKWRVRVAVRLTDTENAGKWSIKTHSNRMRFNVFFDDTHTALEFGGGGVTAWKVVLPDTDMLVRYSRLSPGWDDEPQLMTRGGTRPPTGWSLVRSPDGDGSWTVHFAPADGGPGRQWRVSSARTLEPSAQSPSAGPQPSGAVGGDLAGPGPSTDSVTLREPGMPGEEPQAPRGDVEGVRRSGPGDGPDEQDVIRQDVVVGMPLMSGQPGPGDGRDQVDSPAWSFDLSGWDPALLDSPAPGV
ncbi:hypothetical protein ABZZ74_53740, partial [Streptomyces sp. NPDC006476]